MNYKFRSYIRPCKGQNPERQLITNVEKTCRVLNWKPKCVFLHLLILSLPVNINRQKQVEAKTMRAMNVDIMSPQLRRSLDGKRRSRTIRAMDVNTTSPRLRKSLVGKRRSRTLHICSCEVIIGKEELKSTCVQDKIKSF